MYIHSGNLGGKNILQMFFFVVELFDPDPWYLRISNSDFLVGPRNPKQGNIFQIKNQNQKSNLLHEITVRKMK